MTHRALVVPADPAQPVTVIEWEQAGELEPVLFGAIGCEVLDQYPVLLDGGELAVWFDESGFYVPEPTENARVYRLLDGLGQQAYEVYGTAVLTGGPTASDGAHVGLVGELLGDLQRALVAEPAPNMPGNIPGAGAPI